MDKRELKKHITILNGFLEDSLKPHKNTEFMLYKAKQVLDYLYKQEIGKQI